MVAAPPERSSAASWAGFGKQQRDQDQHADQHGLESKGNDVVRPRFVFSLPPDSMRLSSNIRFLLHRPYVPFRHRLRQLFAPGIQLIAGTGRAASTGCDSKQLQISGHSRKLTRFYRVPRRGLRLAFTLPDGPLPGAAGTNGTGRFPRFDRQS